MPEWLTFFVNVPNANSPDSIRVRASFPASSAHRKPDLGLMEPGPVSISVLLKARSPTEKQSPDEQIHEEGRHPMNVQNVRAKGEPRKADDLDALATVGAS